MKIKDQVRTRVFLPLLTLMFCFAAGQARAQSVPVTLKVTDAPLEQVLSAIEKQTSYLFVYDKSVDVTRRVSIDTSATPLKNVLATLFQPSDIDFAVENTSIVLSLKNASALQKNTNVTGEVLDAAGNPIVGAAVLIKGTTLGTSTGSTGKFTLKIPPPRLRLS